MKTVVITGSTGGIGPGMAQEFLQRGHQVVISGRTTESTEKHRLCSEIVMMPVCLRSPAMSPITVKSRRYGRRLSGGLAKSTSELTTPESVHPRQKFWELPVEQIGSVVNSNLPGVMYGSRVAVSGMMQQGCGQLYNREGLGSNGMIAPGLFNPPAGD